MLMSLEMYLITLCCIHFTNLSIKKYYQYNFMIIELLSSCCRRQCFNIFRENPNIIISVTKLSGFSCSPYKLDARSHPN